MLKPRDYWPRWAQILQQYRLCSLAAWLLEAGGPFLLLSAQALYFGKSWWGSDQMLALAHTLEDAEEANAFAGFLSQEAK